MTIRYALRRTFAALLFVFAVSSASLFLVRWAPGDFVTQTLGTRSTPDDAARLRRRLGLDRSATSQYVDWASGAVRLDFGQTFADRRPVAKVVAERALNTALLAATALLLATLAGVGLGTLTGSRPFSLTATLISRISLVLISMPPLLISLLLIVIAAATRWLPVGGMRSATDDSAAFDLLRHMVVPVLALTLPMAATFERLQAKSIEHTLRAPFIIATRARGVSGARLLWSSALKPSLRAVASLYGVATAGLFSGSFAVEALTAWPGLGRLFVDALRVRDVYLVAGCAMAGASMLAVASLMGDLILAVVDPRSAE